MICFLVVIMALTCSFLSAEVLDRDKMLDVMAKVHGNHDYSIRNDDLEEATEELKCYGHFTRDYDPVCGSNGKIYSNLSMFTYRQCMMKIQENIEIQVKEMKYCKDAQVEDMTHVS
ncbi:Protease inhibitor protein [Plasmopara halstedii]|uniref:Protease inhibitor protein n=1 Tax=Plasmopara halstedii TaxID=4781 RepID=A0A0P1A6T1_PLAHL|nr:Protease inhibitor protein [Plasmopara halstedii]CEG36014.1 Protease inhibitor protein [Plasmopara halstedii]|eukprot:XP_024572383.1 Protease inhibitor protein [Plasmopara halstedii]